MYQSRIVCTPSVGENTLSTYIIRNTPKDPTLRIVGRATDMIKDEARTNEAFSDKEITFRNTRWGMSLDEVVEAEKADSLPASKCSIYEEINKNDQAIAILDESVGGYNNLLVRFCLVA